MPRSHRPAAGIQPLVSISLLITFDNREVAVIGTKGQRDIVLAYSVATFDDLTQEQKNALALYKADINTFATAAKDKIIALKEADRLVKASLEEQKNTSRTSMNDVNFHTYLFQKGTNTASAGYIEQLRGIGMTSSRLLRELEPTIQTLREVLKRKKPPAGVKFGQSFYSNFQLRTEGNTVSVWALGNKGGQANVLVATLFDAITDPTKAYDQAAVPRAKRNVFKKKNFPGLYEQPQHYVQDDDGVFTRRYAVMHKRRSALRLLLEYQYLKGRFSPPSVILDEATALAVDPAVYQVQAFEEHQIPDFQAGATLNLRQMLHVHQELGSGDSARGMCLTSVSISQDQLDHSTWKANLKTMYANPGPAFGDDDKTVLVLIDLAQVPTGNQLLYNLYRPDAQGKAQPVTLQTVAGRFANNTHMLDSVSKNREIFLRVLVPSFVVNYDEVKAETEAGDWLPATGGKAKRRGHK
jgi:hypothetical protein